MAARSTIPTYGVPSERLQQLLLATHTPEVWEVTDQIVITAPTKKRRQQIHDAQMSLVIQQQLLQESINYTLAPRPEYPKMPEPAGARATKAQQAAYQAAVTHFDTLVSQWETLNRDWEASVARLQEVTDTVTARIREDSDAYTRALFGDSYDAVITYFDDQPAELWDLFQTEIQYHFKLAVRPPEVPDDGRCPHCGQVEDGEQAGKASRSSV